MDGDKLKRQRFKRYPIGFCHIDIDELRTAEGKLYLFVAIDRTSKFAVAQLVEKADRKMAWDILELLLNALDPIHQMPGLNTQDQADIAMHRNKIRLAYPSIMRSICRSPPLRWRNTRFLTRLLAWRIEPNV
jgi:hypothetical protein